MSDDLGHGVGYRIPAEGPAQNFDWLASNGQRPADCFEWIHVDIESDVTRRWILERSGLDLLVAQALLETETRPRSAPMAGGVIVVLRGVNLNPGADPEDMVALRIWAEEGRVITARRRRLMAVRDLRRAVEEGRGPRNAGDFLAEISERLVERMAGVIGELNENVDAVEEAFGEDGADSEQRSRLLAIRREAIALRRYLAPQREALARLHNERVAWLTEVDRLHIREVADTTARYVEDLEAARERTALTQEEINNRLSEQMNRRMYALSIVAGIFLPLGFLTGLLGINVGGIPGTESPVAFGLVCAALLALAAGQLYVFRRLRWL